MPESDDSTRPDQEDKVIQPEFPDPGLTTGTPFGPLMYPDHVPAIDPYVIRGIERLTGEHYDPATGEWTGP